MGSDCDPAPDDSSFVQQLVSMHRKKPGKNCAGSTDKDIGR